MKKVTLALAVIAACLFSTKKASAGFVRGDFAATETLDEGVYLIGCEDSENNCGLLAHGILHDYFEADDGSQWTLMDATGWDGILQGIQVRATEGEDK